MNRFLRAKRILCIALLLAVTAAFTPQVPSVFAASIGKPKVSVAVTASSVTLKWKKVSGASRYQVFRADRKNGTYRKIGTTKRLSFKNTGLRTGKMYFYKVRSAAGKGHSAFTEVAATPLAKPVCKSSSLIKENKVRTNPVYGATGYAVYRTETKGRNYEYIGSTRGLAYDDTSAKTGTTYYYKMRAYKSFDGVKTYSSYSDAGRGTRLLAVPKLKKKLVANPDDATKNAVQLTWTSVDAAKGYELYRSGDEGKTYKRIYRGRSLSYIDKNIKEGDAKALKDGVKYYYKVRALHEVFDGIEAYSYASPSKHSREKLLKQAKKWLGYDEKKNHKFKRIVRIYNSYLPLARDIKPAYKEPWCTTFVTASAIKSDMVDIMPRERICRYMIDQYKELGQWVEKDSYVPKPGDLILFDWEDNGKGDCKGAPNHIGIVVSVKNGKIKDIEGNNNDRYGHPVSYRTVKVNSRYIRGFMTPKFDVNNGILFVLNRTDAAAAEAEEAEDIETVELPDQEEVTEEPTEPIDPETGELQEDADGAGTEETTDPLQDEDAEELMNYITDEQQ